MFELARRYYYTLDLLNLPSTEPIITNHNSGVSLHDKTILVAFDEELNVWEIFVGVTTDDDSLRLACLAIALTTPVEKITYDSIRNASIKELGDYYISTQEKIGDSTILFIHLK